MDATRLTDDTFRVGDDVDHTGEFVVGRRTRCDCGVDGYKYRTVLSSAFSTPNTDVVLVTDTSAALTANLVSVDYGASTKGSTGSLTEHNHMETGGDGGNVLKKVFVL